MVGSESFQYRTRSLFGGIKISALSCVEDQYFEPHIHEGYVLWLNSRGGEHYSVAGNRDILQDDSVGLIEPGTVHANWPCRSGFRHLRSLYFSRHLLERLREEGYSRDRAPGSLVIRNRELRTRLVGLHRFLMESGTETALLEEECLELLGLLTDPVNPLRLDLDRESVAGGRDHRTKRIIEYFRENLERNITLQELTLLMDCSPQHIIRLFKRRKGMSPHAYLTQMRLEGARELLDRGASISDAAAHAGFADQSHLTRLFLRRFGVTPGRYIRQTR